MTDAQWAKALKHAHALSGGATPGDPRFLEALRGLVLLDDETELDANLAARQSVDDLAEIEALEARLTVLQERA